MARGRFRLCKQSQWNYLDAKKWLINNELQPYIQKFLARPFDQRFTLWTPHVTVHRRERTFKHFIDHENLGLVCTKGCEVESGWEHIFVTTMPVQHHTLSTKEVNYCFPLFLFDDATSLGGQERRSSIPDKIRQACCAAAGREVSDLEVFNYVYSLVWAPSYRNRFRDLLRAGFPRIFLPSAVSLWSELTAAGQRLIQLHTVVGNGHSVTLAGANHCVEMYRRRGSNIDINATTSILGVSDSVWEFTMGGAQVIQKWLKDRRDRVLSRDDLMSMGSMVHSISETIRIMAEIDEVIDAHGGWPGAFQQGGGNE